mgnify:CR=1 FL=1
MASTWTCSDSHVHEMNRAVITYDSRSAGGEGVECVTSGDRITGMTYASGATAAIPRREWTASTRAEAAAV